MKKILLLILVFSAFVLRMGENDYIECYIDDGKSVPFSINTFETYCI